MFVFLSSLAIENALKGLLVHHDPTCIKDGRLRGELITSHKLILIAQAVDFELDGDEHDLLEHGTQAIESWGRYPIAKNMTSMQSSRNTSIHAISVFEKLFKRLDDALLAKPLPKKEN